MTILSSASNPAVKHLRKLVASPKYRRESGLAVAEGIHLADSFIKSELQISQVIVSQSGLSHNSEIIELLNLVRQLGSPELVLKDSLFEAIFSIHAGVGLAVEFLVPTCDQVSPLKSDAVLLDRVQDASNLGTILRTAAAAGVKQVYVSQGSASAWSPKALRAGMGAQASVSINQSVDLANLIAEASIPVYATALDTERSLYQLDMTSQSAWVFGNEGQGVSPELLDLVTETVKIPQAEDSVESLNVAVSAAVCLFEQFRQRI